MLNKEICRKCRNDRKGYFWNNSSDIMWKRKEVWCPISKKIYISIYDIPDYCPYYTEHLILG